MSDLDCERVRAARRRRVVRPKSLAVHIVCDERRLPFGALRPRLHELLCARGEQRIKLLVCWLEGTRRLRQIANVGS